jgi:DNA-binding response OmpR family regulator
MASILIVEDEIPLRRILTLNLVRRGHSVVEADSVTTTLEAIRAVGAPFDVVLLDINLPDGSGWDVLRQMGWMPHTPRPRVIVVTAVRPVQRRLNEFQPAAVLLKPFPITALLQLIDRELAHDEGDEAALVEMAAEGDDPASSVGS